MAKAATKGNSKAKESQQSDDVANTPKFKLNGMYVKDISFENPLAPAVFINQTGRPRIDVKLDVGFSKLQENTYEVVLMLGTKAENDSGKVTFLVEILYAGLFAVNPNLPEKEHDKILMIDCAAVLFPFARRVIADLTQEGGFPALLLEPVNFEAVYQAKRSQAA